MNLDRRGIQFNIWLYFSLFATGILFILGVPQFLLIRPYYRNNKIVNVKQTADMIESYVIREKNSAAGLAKAFQVAVNNNACINIYNAQGDAIYAADSIGSGCIFYASSQNQNGQDMNLSDSLQLVSKLEESSGEWSIQVMNNKTHQEMIVYGRKIKANLGNYYLFVNSPLEPIDSIVSFFANQYFIYTIVVLVLALIVSMKISQSLTRPIVNMKTEANKLAHADYSASFEGGSFSETKDLASALNGATFKLAKIDELRKDLIANISHDIKTPLTSIKAYAEMIKDISGEDPNKRKKHLDVIIAEADYLDHLVVDMSELSKMQSGNYTLKNKNFDLSEKIKEVVSLHSVMIDEGKINVVLHLEDNLTIFADEIKIAQVLANFLTNAIKHTPKGKSIFIRAKHQADDERVRVEIQDEGNGISEFDLPYIWDRYQKSSRSFSRSMTNTGLGLAIVKAILDTHHAEYGVQTQEGKGSLFWFELKRPSEPEEMYE